MPNISITMLQDLGQTEYGCIVRDETGKVISQIKADTIKGERLHRMNSLAPGMKRSFLCNEYLITDIIRRQTQRHFVTVVYVKRLEQ